MRQSRSRDVKTLGPKNSNGYLVSIELPPTLKSRARAPSPPRKFERANAEHMTSPKLSQVPENELMPQDNQLRAVHSRNTGISRPSRRGRDRASKETTDSRSYGTRE